ncbi:hypothetical protein DH2020_031342 [Rehmannia glutinosa]|uniref:26S proteasome non-ATPase regulatory subunit 2 homolog n=1 Tax=Rehmannia glutinosa TaxID=99300 RepID=A0ABR0VLP9_REHGL
MAPAEPNSTGGATKDQASVKVPSKDPKKKDDKKDEDLSEEDLALKQQLELYVERVQDPDPGLQKVALESMRNLAGEISQEYAKRQSEDGEIDDLMDLVVQIVAFHMKELWFYVKAPYYSPGSAVLWVKTEDIIIYNQDTSAMGFCHLQHLDRLFVHGILSFNFMYLQHNAEPEAVDLLMEVEDLDLLVEHVDEANYKRTCLYLTSSAKYLPGPDDMLVLDIAHSIYMKFKEYPRALQIALYLHNLQGVTFELCEDSIREDEEREAMQELINNAKLSEGYLTLARDIEVMEPKSPEDIYKAHLLDGRGSGGGTVDSARQNLAATFVNAFVNAGFGQDKLMTVQSEAASGGSSTSWLFKNKEHGKASAAASLGMILLWDVDSGLAQLDKYFHSTDTHVIAGALLGVGIVNCNVQNECDPALALLAEYVDKEDTSIKIGAIMGLGLAYAGSREVQVRSLLMPILADGKSPLDVIAFTAVSLGLVYVGSCNEDVAQAIIFALMDRSESELADPLARFLSLGLGLLYLGKQESVEATAEVSKTFNEKIRKHCDMTLLSCAYAGTGNVLKVQHFLGQCAQHLEKGEAYQGPAVLGIAMVAMAEELGLEMAIRSLEHLLQYGEQNIRKAVPLALGLLCISNPKVNVMDTLSRLSHDADSEVAMAAIISLGLIGAGTNNARIAGMLRNLSSYYYKDASLLFCPRMLLTVDENLKPLSVPVRVGQAVDVVGQAGRPKTITGFQTHSTPVLLSAGDRAELATEK